MENWQFQPPKIHHVEINFHWLLSSHLAMKKSSLTIAIKGIESQLFQVQSSLWETSSNEVSAVIRNGDKFVSDK